MSAVATLPGAPIYIKSIGSTGHHQNATGVGSMDFSATRDGQYPWLDMGEVYFSNPTEEQMLDADTAPIDTEAGRDRSNIRRRMSFQQARLVNEVIARALKLTFNGEIPADDEIMAWRIANGF